MVKNILGIWGNYFFCQRLVKHIYIRPGDRNILIMGRGGEIYMDTSFNLVYPKGNYTDTSFNLVYPKGNYMDTSLNLVYPKGNYLLWKELWTAFHVTFLQR